MKRAEREQVMRELTCKGASLTVQPNWEVRSTHHHWTEFYRATSPMHEVHMEKFRDVSVESVLDAIVKVVGEPYVVFASHMGRGFAGHFPTVDLFMLVTNDNTEFGVSFYCPDPNVIKRIIDAKVVPPSCKAKTVHLLISTVRGIELSFAGRINRPLHLSNYAAHTAQEILRVARWAEAPDPYGRITVFAGPPGTGKSFAVRAVITETEQIEWIIVPPQLVHQLTSPAMIQTIFREREGEGPMGLIVEDADSLLRQREQNDENVVGQLLNLGDGLLGDIADMRLILTTNVEKLQIDKALLRPGRLHKFVQFDPLSPEEAAKLYTELTGKSYMFDRPITLSEVYCLANEHSTEFRTKPQEAGGQYL